MKSSPVMDTFHKHSLKMLLAVKLLVILFVVADLNGWIRFGEHVQLSDIRSTRSCHDRIGFGYSVLNVEKADI